MSINATIAVDLLGQCASETIDGAVLLVERRPGRLRPRRDVLRGRAGLRRAALDDRERHLSKIVPDSRRRCGDDDQEHRRQGRHRIRRRRAARTIDPRAGPRP